LDKIAKLREAIAAGEQDECAEIAKELLAEGVAPDQVIKGMTDEIREIG
jgi:methanogenic corrinoid protein MtbC1